MQTHSHTTPTDAGTTRTLTTSKGRSCVTPYTNEQAVQVLAAATDRSEFEESLISRKALTRDQFVWVHICALRRTAPKPQGEKIGDFAKIGSIFANAKTHLKWPKLNLKDAEGHALILSVAGDASRNAGQIYVKCGDLATYFGRIDQQGEFHATQVCPSTVAPYLRRFAANPEAEAAAYGKLTGQCCFCNRKLSDERSIEVGYGPVCAAKWGLAWGK